MTYAHTHTHTEHLVLFPSNEVSLNYDAVANELYKMVREIENGKTSLTNTLIKAIDHKRGGGQSTTHRIDRE